MTRRRGGPAGPTAGPIGRRALAASVALGAVPLGAVPLGAMPTVARAALPASTALLACAAARPATPRAWPAPLDRAVTLPTRALTLRAALDRVASAGRFRLSYTAELLALDRRACALPAGVSAGDALVALAGAAVEPVVVARDQVVLAPVRRDAADASAASSARAVGRLDPVLVTGSTRVDDRATTHARDVVDGATLAARAEGSLAGALDAVPGVWLWAPSPSSLVSRWGSLRGASSFGVSAPKIYVDGIEVANPLLVTGLVPEAVERVEVIRGPQGAALHGADAIGGVIDIVTRGGGSDGDGPRVQLRSDAGPSRSEYSGESVMAQRHALSLRAGSGARTGGVALSLGTLGDYVPGGASRELAAHGDARLLGPRGALALTARLLDKSAGATRAPRAASATAGPGALAASALSAAGARAMRQYTLGATATFAGGARWTPRATLGVDGYRLTGALAAGAPPLSAADSALNAARGGADRITMRVSTVGRFGDDATRSATVTLAAEHTELRETTAYDVVTTHATASVVEQAWRNSTGVVALTSLALRDALFLTGGLRFERDAGYGDVPGFAALPMLGAAAARDVLGATVKLRAAYGRAIRPPRGGLRDGLATLGAEAQAGVEAGADVTFGDPSARGVALHVTRFDQRASGLLQPVRLAGLAAPVYGAAISGATVSHATHPRATTRSGTTYGLARRNAGEIANRGWELQSVARLGGLSLAGAVSLVDSRVARVVQAGALGDVRAGDRTLDVPSRTASLTAAWTWPRWSASWGLARAADWVGYDRTALARALATDPTLGGADLRAFRRAYDGVTRLRASVTRDVTRGVSLTVAGDNLLDRQHGEPDDVTVVPGRTVTLGLRARF